ncbi:MAG: MBL fold metallo-hydrolase [Lachnospiraceae bacterium]|nr:MBL fold metallo-hydrolase [Lachnospiraceae bacterium]
MNKTVIAFSIAAIVVVFIISLFAIRRSNKPEELSELTVHFIDVGQGDSTLIICGGEAMLIDAGNNDKGTSVQLYLQKQGIDKLKYVVSTHPDADHLGGLDVIIYKYDCNTVFMSDVKSDSISYQEVLDTLNNKWQKPTVPSLYEAYNLGDATFSFVGPVNIYDSSNNNSLIIKLEHGQNSFLFTGDQEKEAEDDLLSTGISLKADVLKIAHHGSHSSTGTGFLRNVSPQYAVISCGDGNEYGFPHREVMDSLKRLNCKVFRTDEQGSIVVKSNGIELNWNVEPSTTWNCGIVTRNPDSPADEDKHPDIPFIANPETTYILNKSSLKFHNPNCEAVQEMNPLNREETTEDRDALLNAGYVPCKACKP